MNSSALGLETSSTFTGSARVSFQLWQLTTSVQKWIFFFPFGWCWCLFFNTVAEKNAFGFVIIAVFSLFVLILANES